MHAFLPSPPLILALPPIAFFLPGDFIFRAGDVGDNLYVIQRGEDVKYILCYWLIKRSDWREEAIL